MKLPLLIFQIVTGLFCVWSLQVLPKCTSRKKVLKYHKCMQSKYGIENVYREACIDWMGQTATRNITEPKCLHHLQLIKKPSLATKNNKKIDVTCPSYRASPVVHFPDNVTLELHIQTSDKQCEQIEQIQYRFPDANSNAKKNAKCKKPKWNPNGITVAANLTGPRGVYIDQNDNLYVTDLGHRRLQKFSNSSKTGVVITNGTNTHPVDVCIDAYGNIFKTTGEQWTVKSSGSMSISSGNTDQKDCTFGTFLNTKTDMYVADSLGNFSTRIRKYSSSPSTHLKNSSSVVKVGVGASAKQRYAVFVDQCDTFNTVNVQEEEIRTHLNSNYTPNWGYIEPKVLIPHDTYPSSMLHHFGSYYIVGREENCVLKLGQGIIAGVPSGDDAADPSYGIGFEFRSAKVPVGSDQKKKNKTVTNVPSQAVSAGAKHLNEPISIAFDSKSNLYVADFKNNRVQKFLLQSGDVKC